MQGLKNIKTVRDFELQDKIVFLRLDLNVPMEGTTITDETRIQAALPTIQYLRDHGAKVIMASHLGRPKSAADKEFSLEPVAKRLSEHLKTEVLLLDEPDPDAIKHLVQGMKRSQVMLLENVRFEPGETKDSEEFAQRLAQHVHVYINDAFGASHRAHATIHALPKMMKDRGIGFLIEKEIQFLDQLLSNPTRPYWAVLGGAKVSDKIAVIEKLLDVVDGFVIGGAMAYTFLKAMNHSVGKSLVEQDKVRYAAEMIERIKARNKSLLLPVDHLITTDLHNTRDLKTTSDANIPDGYLGVDIGPKTISQFQAALSKAKTIFWNGPMGVFETPEMAKGTFAVARMLAEADAMKVVGGGDSAAAAEASGFASRMTHISTGGGASLEYLQGDALPGLEALRYKHGR
ncbi:MAG: phosphoglycerate kinase [Bdellovibrionales bacterium]